MGSEVLQQVISLKGFGEEKKKKKKKKKQEEKVLGGMKQQDRMMQVAYGDLCGPSFPSQKTGC